MTNFVLADARHSSKPGPDLTVRLDVLLLFLSLVLLLGSEGGPAGQVSAAATAIPVTAAAHTIAAVAVPAISRLRIITCRSRASGALQRGNCVG